MDISKLTPGEPKKIAKDLRNKQKMQEEIESIQTNIKRTKETKEETEEHVNQLKESIANEEPGTSKDNLMKVLELSSKRLEEFELHIKTGEEKIKKNEAEIKRINELIEHTRLPDVDAAKVINAERRETKYKK